jgi:hypothetical protein
MKNEEKEKEKYTWKMQVYSNLMQYTFQLMLDRGTA